jgi:hypothetical protein
VPRRAVIDHGEQLADGGNVTQIVGGAYSERPSSANLLGVSFAGGDRSALSREELSAGRRVFFERLTAE